MLSDSCMIADGTVLGTNFWVRFAVFENGKMRVQITMFLTHSLNYRRQRHLAARQRPLAAKHKNAKTKRLPYEIWKNKNAIRLRIFSHILYYLLRFEQKKLLPIVKQPNPSPPKKEKRYSS